MKVPILGKNGECLPQTGKDITNVFPAKTLSHAATLFIQHAIYSHNKCVDTHLIGNAFCSTINDKYMGEKTISSKINKRGVM